MPMKTGTEWTAATDSHASDDMPWGSRQAGKIYLRGSQAAGGRSPTTILGVSEKVVAELLLSYSYLTYLRA